MHFTIKPVSFTCNLVCDYCFYLAKGNSFLKAAVMKEDVLEDFIRKYIEVSDKHVFFTWQGGEPMLCGIDFYKKALELQQKYAGGKIIENAIQTNGTLINEEWCQFLKDNNFLVGISIDGPKEIHDIYRVDRHGNGSFDRVMHGIELLKQYKIEFNTLTCINRANYNKGLEVYKFLKSIGSKYMQFSEVLETTPENTDVNNVAAHYELKPFAINGKDYATFFTDIFKYWVANDIGEIVVRQFETFISTVHGGGALSCVFENQCTNNLVIEANGDVYQCDQFVYERYRIGNIKDLTLEPTKDYAHNLNAIKSTLPEDCKECMYLALCNGGCPKHRIVHTATNGVNKTHFCEGYKALFKVMTPYLNAMVSLSQSKIPYIKVKEIADKIDKI